VAGMSARATRSRDDHDGHPGPATTDPADPTRVSPDRDPSRAVDPRAVRIALGRSMAHVDVPAMVIEPPEIPLVPAPRTTGRGILGGVAAPRRHGEGADQGPGGDPQDTFVLVDEVPVHADLQRLDAGRAVLRVFEPSRDAAGGDGSEPAARRILFGPLEGDASDGRGVSRRELVVDGWRIELEIESERRAALRDRARRGRAEAAQGGPTEVHAIIPGRVVAVSVVAGDAVVASQQLLVVEAMKMQNELRAPRDGTITRVAVGAGENIEVGDLLLVLE
jgi:biotin carboxyl carrier protein